ncbi:MAG TPA: hypothetical protein VFG89_00265 [Coriobacteriia bacterium]|nr:hypothetical protein [Coriobacteriia bacterium]
MRSRFMLVAALAVLVVVAAPATALAERTLGLSTGTFSFDVQPGAAASGTVDVMNDGDETLTVLAYAADQQVDETGTITYQVPGRDQALSMTDPASWITLRLPVDTKAIGNVPTLSLQPGERVPVSFEIDVPKNVASGDHNLIVFFEMQGKNAEGQASSAVAGRLGARVRLRVAGNVERSLSVRPFIVPAFVLGRTVSYDFLVRNAGNVDERVTANVELRDRNEVSVGVAKPIDAKTVFSKSNLAAKGKLTAVKQLIGPQRLVLSVSPQELEANAGASAEIVEERTVWMIPLWAAAIFGVLLLALFAGILMAAFRKVFPGKPEVQRVASDEDLNE